MHEAYAELALPLVSGMPGLDLVELQAAARIFRYAGYAADWTWKLGARWRPLRDVTLRGTLSTAFRAPSVQELHYDGPPTSVLVWDPCAGVNDMGVPAPVSPWCGDLAGKVEPFPVITVESHGNRGLAPETARVYTAGLVLEPRFAKDLTITFDAWGVAIDHVIQGDGDALYQCYPMAADARPQFCQYVERDPATGKLLRAVDTPVNAGSERMWGLDLAVRHGVKSPLGRIGLRLDGSWLGRYDLVQADGTVVRARGTYDLSAQTQGAFLYPVWKASAGTTWQLDGLGAALDVRALGGFKECAGPEGNIPSAYTVQLSRCSFTHGQEHDVPPYATWNAQLSFGLRSGAGRTELVLGVENLLDTAPPRVYSNLVYPSDPGYDFVGRFFWLRLSHRILTAAQI